MNTGRAWAMREEVQENVRIPETPEPCRSRITGSRGKVDSEGAATVSVGPTFVAVDFELANQDRSSVCAVGLVLVVDGRIGDEQRLLVRPAHPYFDPFYTSVHGITEADVKDSPQFIELWPAIREFLGDRPLVSHFASFDISVLRHTLDSYSIPYPETQYACSWLVSRKLWPNLMSHSLDIVADFLGIGFAHHDPVEDARAAAQVLLRACQHARVDELDALLQHLGIGMGRVFPGSYSPSGFLSSHTSGHLRPGDLVPMRTDFDLTHPLYGKTVVFTGTLGSMLRKQAWQKVLDLGGACLDSMTEAVDYLVVGELDLSRLKGQTKSGKLRKAEVLRAKGKAIEIISEPDFLRILAS